MNKAKYISLLGVCLFLLFLGQQAKAQGSPVHLVFAEGAPFQVALQDGGPASLYFNVKVSSIEEVAYFIINERSADSKEEIEVVRFPVTKKANDFYLGEGTLIFQGFIKHTLETPPQEPGSTVVYTLFVIDHQGMLSNKLEYRLQ